MRALTLCLVAAGALGIGSGFAAEEKSIVGQDAPAIETKEFLQSDGRTQVADFKGEVLYIECFATW
jgi:hypothetical protein